MAKEQKIKSALASKQAIFRFGVTPTFVIPFLLIVLTVVAYWPLRHCDFVNYDDPEYTWNNPIVSNGITFQGICQAFTTFLASNWHPLTWVSLMIDFQLYGLHPLGYHLTNLGLHIGNTLLLFAIFFRLTGARWRSAAVAALFALHPMHVESVAWIAERKDVLSTFFGLLSTCSYWRFVNAQSRRRLIFWYGVTLLCFVLALLSKPMLVTLPFLWLLLDHWPLSRVCTVRLLFEKIPFFCLSIVACWLTLAAQEQAMVPMHEKTSWLFGGIISVQAYWAYIGKLFFPLNLAVLYPLPSEFHLWQTGVAALPLIAISVVAIILRRMRPWVFVGWFWFIGTLVPVVGFVKVGVHFIADRYTYLPSVGLCIIVVWGIAECLRTSKIRAAVAGCLLVTSSLIFAALTHAQVKYWTKSLDLFQHCLAVTKGNAIAEDTFGTALVDEKRFDEAKSHFERAIQLLPDSPTAHNHLGNIYLREGKQAAAIAEYRTAIAYDTSYAAAYANIGEALLKAGALDESLQYSLKSISLSTNTAAAFYNAGTVYLLQHQTNNAIDFFEKALHLRPTFPEAHNNLAFAFAKIGRQADARVHYVEAIRLRTNYVEARENFAVLLLKQKKFIEAEQQYLAALQEEPDNAEAHYQLGVVYQTLHRNADAVVHWRRAIELKPSWGEALNNLSWLLSTCSDPAIRNGAEALKLARRLEIFTGDTDSQTLDTLAAAYAEMGEFDQAIEYEKKAIGSALQSAEPAEPFKQRLMKYQEHQPYRE